MTLRKSCSFLLYTTRFLIALFICTGVATTQLSALTLTSTAFKHEGLIDPIYTCDGDNISPPLQWADAPDGTQSFVLICDDPKATHGNWNHWILYNIPVTTTSLPQNISTFTDGTLQGTTSFKSQGFGGPCPPTGEHPYYFKLYALDLKTLPVDDGADKATVGGAMQGHILAETALMGRYTRLPK